MDGVYIIFILVEHHLSFFSFYYILEELYLMVHTFIIQFLVDPADAYDGSYFCRFIP